MRTTAADVKLIIETTLTDIVVESYILTANTMVNDILGLTESDESSSSVSHAKYTEIERWLTAHLIATTRERMAKKEEVGGAKIEYMGKDGLGLSSTPYGQMVLSMDTSGAFAIQEGSRRTATFRAIPQN